MLRDPERFSRQGHIIYSWRSRLGQERDSVLTSRWRFWPVTCCWWSLDWGNPSQSPELLPSWAHGCYCAWDHKVGHLIPGHISLPGREGLGRMLSPRLESEYEIQNLATVVWKSESAKLWVFCTHMGQGSCVCVKWRRGFWKFFRIFIHSCSNKSLSQLGFYHACVLSCFRPVWLCDPMDYRVLRPWDSP